MEYVSFAVETVIAILGLIITVIEVMKSKKEKRAEKEKKAIFKRLITEISAVNLTELIESIRQDEYFIGKFHDMKPEDIFEGKQNKLFLDYYNQCNNYLTSYDKFVDAIEAVYRSMVKNEDCFSLSYGFGRYIIVFREFISVKNKIENIREDNERGFAKIDANFTKDKVMAVFSQVMTQKMVYIYDARKENHEERIRIINCYIEDETIGLNVVKDRKERDRMAWEGFYWIINNRKAIQSLEEKIKELEPVIREIQIKYDLENTQ